MCKLLNAIASSLQIQVKIFFKQRCLSTNALVNFLVLHRIWAVSDGFPAISVGPNRNHEIFRQGKSSADGPLDHNFELQGCFPSLHGTTSRDISSTQITRFGSFGSALSLFNTRQIIASTRAKTSSKLLSFLKKQNPRRGGQGSAGGWLEASNFTRCQPKDPRNPSVASRSLQARSLSNIRALCTTFGLALASIVFAVVSPVSAQFVTLGAQGCSGGCVWRTRDWRPRKLQDLGLPTVRRLSAFLIAAALCLPVSASAWWRSIQQVGVSTGSSYTGPGDVYNSTWYAWWGVARAFNAATAGTKLINLCDHNGANCTDVSTSATTGALNAPTAIGADDCTVLTTCQIHTLYDKSGSTNCSGPCDMVSQQFQITFTWNSGKPYAIFNSGIGTYMQPASQNSAASQPLSVTGVVNNDIGQFGQLINDASGVFAPLNESGSNEEQQFGSSQSAPNSAGTLQTYQSIANGSSSALIIDGFATTGLASGSNGITVSDKLTIGGGGGSTYYGHFNEIGIASTVAWNSTQYNAMCHNERLYYGTGGSC